MSIDKKRLSIEAYVNIKISLPDFHIDGPDIPEWLSKIIRDGLIDNGFYFKDVEVAYAYNKASR